MQGDGWCKAHAAKQLQAHDLAALALARVASHHLGTPVQGDVGGGDGIGQPGWGGGGTTRRGRRYRVVRMGKRRRTTHRRQWWRQCGG
jgi:hypothetical protein